MAHAVRAIRALRLEMTRREQLLNYAGVADIRDLSNPPARLIIMADEFLLWLSDLPSLRKRFFDYGFFRTFFGTAFYYFHPKPDESSQLAYQGEYAFACVFTSN